MQLHVGDENTTYLHFSGFLCIGFLFHFDRCFFFIFLSSYSQEKPIRETILAENLEEVQNRQKPRRQNKNFTKDHKIKCCMSTIFVLQP